MRVQIERRLEAGMAFSAAVIGFALAGGLLVVGFLFLLKGADPLHVIVKVFSGSFGSVYGLKETLAKAIPLVLIGVGLCIPFQAKFWNIGAEGQLLAGAVAATWYALNVAHAFPLWVNLPLMMLSGALGGALWSSIPVLLKERFGVNEVIATLMLNYIAFELVTLLVVGPWRGATQQGYPYTDDFPLSARIPLLPGTRIHLFTLVVALVAVGVAWIILYRTRLGYEVRVVGESRDAARYAGIHTGPVLLFAMALSGALAGLAGVGEVAAIHYHLSYPANISAGYGFTGIIVAWLARRNPVLVPLTAFFFAGIAVGGDALQISVGLPASTVQVFNGILLLSLVAAEFFLNYRIVIRSGRI
ncbi:ABC-type transporter, integral membrane subunit [Spirochaeta thermophila DSM 6578]|uniref:ABC-type transporter, integral membrane subunit n=1 Tax=Winmispira thermophila (strain ATCC 700085 / DSM 6578 / Z-1203) TaxID=869211 RepID=G0GDT4_WINT7|nr:ABC transporter permease [Spirochaeta thermophila]AEJ62214.1 ABC-type transporter, integral membrane subunit [Spirochaeta thermophila DSM 6578]